LREYDASSSSHEEQTTTHEIRPNRGSSKLDQIARNEALSSSIFRGGIESILTFF
jgi:hypothetical protein